MNKVYIIVIALLSYLSLSAQENTVIITADGADIEVGEQFCLNFTANNFDSIAAFQLPLFWDPETFEFISIDFPSFNDVRHNMEETGIGKLASLWTEPRAQGITLPDGETFMTLCMIALSDINPVITNWRSPNEDTLYNSTEFVGVSPLDVRPVKFEIGPINVTNFLDCFMIPFCEQNLSVQFEERVEIFLEDLVHNLDYKAQCHGYDQDSIYIRKSGTNSLSRSVRYSCTEISPINSIDIVNSDGEIICTTNIQWQLSGTYEDCIDQVIDCDHQIIACESQLSYVLEPGDSLVVDVALLIDNLGILEKCDSFDIYDYYLYDQNDPTDGVYRQYVYTCENATLPGTTIFINGPTGVICAVDIHFFTRDGVECGRYNDCHSKNKCIESMEATYEPGTEIYKEDLIGDMSALLRCYGLQSAENVKIINLSEPGAEPHDLVTFTCDNVYNPTYLGIVISDERVAAPTLPYQLICQSQIVWNIPDIYENCDGGVRACTDPSRCQDIVVSVTETSTLIPYSDIVSSDGYSDCDISYQYDVTTDAPPHKEKGILLQCPEYSESLLFHLGMTSELASGQQLVAYQWCTSEITLDGIAEACDPDSITNDYVPITVTNERTAVLSLNGEPLVRSSDYLHLMKKDKILDIFNTIEVSDVHSAVTTLDVVKLYRAIISGTATQIEAIAGDVDLSGSLTTKDIKTMRHHILGLEIGEYIDQPFLVEGSQLDPNFDPFDFNNGYERYQFDGPSLSAEGLSFAVGNIGDFFSDSSIKANIRSSNSTAITLIDQYVHAGQSVDIPINSSDVYALSVALDLRGLEITGISHDHTDQKLQYHLESAQRTNISFFSPMSMDIMSATLHVRAISDGQLSDMISIGSSIYTEAVTLHDTPTDIALSWTADSQTPGDVCYYPNPTSDVLHIDLPTEYVGGTLSVYSIIGAPLYERAIDDTYLQLDLRDVESSQVLIVRLQGKEALQTFRVRVLK